MRSHPVKPLRLLPALALLGAMAAPPHLDAAVWRWPGEPEDSFYRRLLSLVRGSGVVHVRLHYRGDLAAPPVSSLLH